MLESRLVEIRDIFGVSKRNLAAMLGVTPQTVCNYEDGKTSMSLLKAIHYSRTLWNHRHHLSKDKQYHLYDCLKIYLEAD